MAVSNRKPVAKRPNPTDANGNYEEQAKSAWAKSGKRVSLKQFARSQSTDEACQRWLHNKRANDSNPPLGVGRTRKRRGDSNNKPAAAAPKKGR